MSLARLVATGALLATLASAQESTVEIVVEQKVSVPRDTAVTFVEIQAPLGTSAAEVIAALQTPSLSEATLQSETVTAVTGCRPSSRFTFRVARPLSELTGILAELTGTKERLAARQPAWSISIQAQAMSNPQSLAAAIDRAKPNLLAEARYRAKSLAEAAGLHLGSLIGTDEISSAGIQLLTLDGLPSPKCISAVTGSSSAFIIPISRFLVTSSVRSFVSIKARYRLQP